MWDELEEDTRGYPGGTSDIIHHFRCGRYSGGPQDPYPEAQSWLAARLITTVDNPSTKGRSEAAAKGDEGHKGGKRGVDPEDIIEGRNRQGLYLPTNEQGSYS